MNLREAYNAELAEQNRASEQYDAFRLWLSMIVIDTARKMYAKERKLSEHLGFDVVEIGGEG